MDSHALVPLEKKHETIVYIFNMSEDVWPFISAMSDTRSRLLEIEENIYLADLRLFMFANEDSDILFVSPTEMSDTFTTYFKSLFGIKQIRILVPKKHSGVISNDVLEDEIIMMELVKAANSSRRLTVTSYATTLQFLDVIRELRKRSITVYTPEAPEEEDAWTVNFYGSKSGIRQFAQQSGNIEPDFQMANGLICVGIDDASKIAANKYLKEHGVVIKTNKGHAGMGLLLLRQGDLPENYIDCEKAIKKLLKKESYWDKFPIIIESFVVVNPTIAGGFPNVEFKIAKSGRAELLFVCGMRMSLSGVFGGIEISDEVMPERIATQIVDTGFFIAEQYAQAGYRGYFDVDFMLAKNGQLYITESNVRSTGGTFVYTLAVKLAGRDFMHTNYIFSNNGYSISHLAHPTFTSIYERLQPILFQKSIGEGLVMMSENLLLMRKFAYVIMAKNKKRALEIEARMVELLKG